MFHCFQYAGLRAAGARTFPPMWIMEGQAEWAGESVFAPSQIGRDWWALYFKTPGLPLFGRTYDASGFYYHLEESGINPWSVIDPMLAAADNVGAFKAAGATSEQFLDTWASGLLRLAGSGVNWRAQARWQDTDGTLPEVVSVEKNDGTPVAAQPVANLIVFVGVKNGVDIVEARLEGHTRIGGVGLSPDLIHADQAWLCLKAGGCRCPEGSSYSGPPLVDTDGPFYVALTGALDGAQGTLSGHGLEDFCVPDPDPPEEVCENGCAVSTGDPHIETVDGHHYDFQAAGEFILLRDAGAGFELQARQEPAAGSSYVSVNTAVALSTDGHRAVFTAASNGLTPDVTIDGVPIALSEPARFGGMTIGRRETGIQVKSGDGSRVIVFGQRDYGLHVVVDPSPTLRSAGAGIMGVVPEGAVLPALPDGTAIEDASGPAFQVTHGDFADAWRVTDDNTLFDYEPGITTASFSISGFPDPWPSETFTPAQRTAAEEACSGVPAGTLRDWCVFDVAVTGLVGYAENYRATAQVLANGESEDSGERMRVVNFLSDGIDVVDVDVYSWAGDPVVSAPVFQGTVPFGTAGNWFDPGLGSSVGERRPMLSIVAHGEPVGAALNLIDFSRRAMPGSSQTLVLSNGPGGAAKARVVALTEESGGEVLEPIADGGAYLAVDTSGLAFTHESVLLYASVGTGCLTQPDFRPGNPTGLTPIAQPIGVTGESGGEAFHGPLWVDPGADRELTLHRATEPTASALCEGAPVGGPIPLSLRAGERAHLLLYSRLGAELMSMVLPFGEG